MSTPREPYTQPTTRGEWLRCDDCDSTVHETWTGAVLVIEVEHSSTCPVWREDAREVALAFLPSAERTEP